MSTIAYQPPVTGQSLFINPTSGLITTNPIHDPAQVNTLAVSRFIDDATTPQLSRVVEGRGSPWTLEANETVLDHLQKRFGKKGDGDGDGDGDDGKKPNGGWFWKVAASLGLTILAAIVLKCRFDTSGLEFEGDAGEPDADVGDGGVDATADAGDAGDAVVPTDGAQDADLDAQTDGQVVDDRPILTDPQLVTLPNNRVFVKWDDPQTTQPGKVIVGYRVEWTVNSTPSTKDVVFPHTALDIRTPNANCSVRVRVRYNDGISLGDWSNPIVFNTDGSLVAAWDLDETVGTTAPDSSVNGYDGTLVNSPTWTPAFVGNGLLFDGLDTYVDTGDAGDFDSSDPFTIEAWVQRSSVDSADYIFGKYDLLDTTVRRGYWFSYYPVTNELVFNLTSNASTNDMLRISTTAQFATPNIPQHLTLTYNGSMQAAGAKIYVDGVDQTVNILYDTLTGTTVNSVPSRIGASIAYGGPLQNAENVLAGIIDEVALYNRVFTSTSGGEIRNSICGRESKNRENNNDPTPLPSPLCD